MSKIDDLIKELCPDGVEFKKLGSICKIETGKLNANASCEDGKYPFFTTAKEISRIDTFRWDEEALLIAGNANVGDVKYFKGKFEAYQRTYVLTDFSNLIDIRFLFFCLSNNLKQYLESRKNDAAMTYIVLGTLQNFPIPVPPLEVQKEIVRVLDSFTELEAELEAELEVRKKQYEYYRNTLLTFEDDKNITWVELGEVAKYEQPSKYIVRSSDYNDNFSIPVLTAGKTFILGYTDESSGIYNASVHPVIIFDDFTTANKWVDFDFKVKSSAMKIITSLDEGTALLKYIYHWLNTLPSGLVEGDHKRQWISSWSKKKIPIPPLEKQKQIVSILDKFEKLTNDISVGLPAEIEARRKQYEYYRNKLLTFKELECSR